MPFKSLKQKKLIMAAAHNPDFAKKVGFEQSAAQKFVDDSQSESTKSLKSDFSDDSSPKRKKFSKIKSLMS
jgi:hypothetical protein